MRTCRAGATRARAWLTASLGAAAILSSPAARCGAGEFLDPVLALAGVQRLEAARDFERMAAQTGSPGRLALTGRLLSRPVQAADAALVVGRAFERRIASPAALIRGASSLARTGSVDGGIDPGADPSGNREIGGDPLARALGDLFGAAGAAPPSPTGLPGEAPMPGALRRAVADVLSAIAKAEAIRRKALRDSAVALDPGRLTELVRDEDGIDELASLLSQADLPLLDSGLALLVQAIEDLRSFLLHGERLPETEWRIDTPLGAVVIDTRSVSDRRVMRRPLLLVDAGGDDSYEIVAGDVEGPISIVLDLDGDDRYRSIAPARGVASGVLGYGIVWDCAGDDDYAGEDFDLGAALLGGGALIDEAGDDRYRARGFSQAFALGGVAMLADLGGRDRYEALTHSQASGASHGIGLMIEGGGDDSYRLDASPLVSPSAQLPDRNASMGQGAGRGFRSTGEHASSLVGGIGVLLDLAGNDSYRAQVFAQGAAYWEASGMLIDMAGTDLYRAAWYAGGASAHGAAAVLIDLGDGDDDHRVSHSTALGAAHDASVAVLLDAGGNDRYALGGLGFGAAHDGGAGLFIDGGGDDRYELHRDDCRAFGAVPTSLPDGSAQDVSAIGLFVDAAGSDAYQSACPAVTEGGRWTWTAVSREAGTGHRRGAGIDAAMAQTPGIGAALTLRPQALERNR